jgi:hypothetical protein
MAMPDGAVKYLHVLARARPISSGEFEGRSVFPHRRMKNPVEFRPPRVAAHVDLYTARLKIACREHAAHYVLKDLLLDGIEAVLLAQWIDERDLGRVRPDLRE